MVRYIDADKYLNELDKQICSDCFDDAHCCSCGVGCARAIAMELPPVDVVPKSEVERLTVELEAMRGAANSYKMHYENLAREIFEEIERLITNECLVIEDERGIRGYVDASVHYAIADLKKKYTENLN